ncbi:MAG: hypothetical protein CMC53_00465 [Flavobacteriaceae bacterium]|nr:hypothetical protein [Flavobacteriaceae bacterium]|tara:strand:- start:256 stop:750 length:495 start_codon:yes stop_codon:yes gene_type:complete
MKNILLTIITVTLFVSCETQNGVKIDDSPLSGTISQTDERNDLVNKFVDAYQNADPSVALELYAENAVVHVNDTELTPIEMINAFMDGHVYYDQIKNVDRNTTTMFYNSGEIYTNYWYTWNGTNKNTGELLSVRGYAWFKWDGMKVIESYNAFDPTEYNKAFIE